MNTYATRWSPRVKALLDRVRMAGPERYTYYRMDTRALLIRDACGRLESARAASQLGDRARAARWLSEAADIRRQIPSDNPNKRPPLKVQGWMQRAHS